MILSFMPVNIDEAPRRLVRDMYSSPHEVFEYVMLHRLSYLRMPASNMLGYVATLYGRVNGGERAEDSFNDGATLGLRSILLSEAAKIGLRMALSDVDPLHGLSDDDDKSLAGLNAVITERSNRALQHSSVAGLPYESWVPGAAGPEAAEHMRQGYAFTLEAARTAADNRLNDELRAITG